MLRIVVDSGSSIKQEEKENYGIDILPIRIQMGNDDFLDGINLNNEEFYHRLKEKKEFPKTALPSLSDTQALVERYTSQGDQVLILTISSEISGTWQTFTNLFEENPDVLVFDTRLAVGGIRFLVMEAIRYRDEPLSVIRQKLEELIPRIVIAAIPETLDYLFAGGRLSRAGWMAGTLLSIHPIIGFTNGKVTVLKKKRGIRAGMRAILDMLNETGCDPDYGIIASYTDNDQNLQELIRQTSPSLQKQICVHDNLCPSIACHWGPNAFGYIYVKKQTAKKED
ncbi:DegV family protein [Parablautia sp. Marseille-Q6255]|uniref:DegV family protein n=1 Tax=Parablautia sp. Marseille-Q6255 TaxID=3039593 RepID=UPI0024BD4B90|nr:DegV family protein [Parablautia sp. Marseille-Q6255]